MPVIGTAGHVDHGKSALLNRLTGRDPDRWAEEKRRGLTIDLGFTWMTLPSGIEISFVDVPGHQRYARNMLAGIEAIDLALLVVAADEGWMPQTEEHIVILDLFGIDRGIVVISKTDLVDDDLIELAILEVEEKLVGTSLRDSPIIGVSAETGRGLDELITEMDRQMNRMAMSIGRDRGAARLWVDRSFSIAGAGTVITGTLLGDSMSVGEELIVWPSGLPARIRAIESHEKHLSSVEPNRRVALNVTGVDPDQVARGTMLGRRGEWDVSRSLIARLAPVVRAGEIPERGSFQLHIGSAWTPVTLRHLDDDLTLIRMDRPLPLRIGDRFAIRDSGRQAVAAGGVVLDPAPGSRPRKALSQLQGIDLRGSADEIADALLEVRGSDKLSRLRAHTGGQPGAATVIEEVAYSETEQARLKDRITGMVDRFHRENPLRPGIPVASAASKLGASPVAVRSLGRSIPGMTEVGPHLARIDHQPAPSADQDAAWERARLTLSQSGLAVPRIRELGLEPEHLHYLVRRGDLVKASDEFAFLPEQAARLKEVIGKMPAVFTVAEFRDATALTRLHLVPILEWSDREGITSREGDTRRVR